LTRLEITRAVATALPDRDRLVVGNLAGGLADHRWRVDVLPYTATNVDQRQALQWVPLSVVITVRSPDGAMLQLNTLRLQHRGGA
jgi:hypothetical protein